MTRVASALACTAAALALVAAPAEAARYVASDGSPAYPCSVGLPCDLETGVEGAVDGEEVIVTPGRYGSPDMPYTSAIASAEDIDVHGVEGQARPTLHSNADLAFSLSNPAATLTHFGIVSYDDNGTALSLTGASADRVFSSGGASPAVEGCVLSGNATLTNSVCMSNGDAGLSYAIEAGGSATLRGVTAWSTGSMGVGLEVTAGQVEVASSILQGGTDVRTNDPVAIPLVAVTLTYSDYDTATESPSDPVTDPGTGTNQTTAPMLVNPAAGDFHQLAASPTVDKGAPGSAAETGAFDIDGGPRSTGTGPDIGADEIAPPPGGGGPGGGPGGGGPGGGGADHKRPSMSALAFSPPAFLPLRSGPSIPSAVRGTRVFYELSEPARVAFRVERAAPGRRVGGRCVRPTRRNAHRRRCVRWVRVRGGFSHSGAAGANSFRFSGRIRGRALRRGRYRLVARPVDLAGNRGKVTRRAFRILRRR